MVFAGIIPHAPVLLPALRKPQEASLAPILSAIETFSDAVYASHPDTVLLLSSHRVPEHEAFVAEVHEPYELDFRSVGDMVGGGSVLCDVTLADRIQRRSRAEGLSTRLQASQPLDLGFSVPLALLVLNPKVRALGVSSCRLSPKDHLAYGRMLKEVVLESPSRIAVICSGDLSHCLTTAAPGGYCAEGAEFDGAVRQAVHQGSASGLLALDPLVVTRAAECTYLPLLTLFGVLDGRSFETEEYAYEAPFGVGYLVAEFHL